MPNEGEVVTTFFVFGLIGIFASIFIAWGVDKLHWDIGTMSTGDAMFSVFIIISLIGILIGMSRR